MGTHTRTYEGKVFNSYLEKHIGFDLSLVDDFHLPRTFVSVNAEKGKIDIKGEREREYIIKDRKLIFYYDFLCTGEIVESLKASNEPGRELVINDDDLDWFVKELKKRKESRE